VNQKGYGIAVFWEKAISTHRLAYALANDGVPLGKHVLHHCDNPPCCNPSHLWVGTNQENHWDKERKGRGNHATGDKNGSRKHPERMRKGSKHGRAKLTEEQVLEIRRRYSEKGVFQYQLA